MGILFPGITCGKAALAQAPFAEAETCPILMHLVRLVCPGVPCKLHLFGAESGSGQIVHQVLPMHHGVSQQSASCPVVVRESRDMGAL